MITNTGIVKFTFAEHELAHKYLDQYEKGIEIGAAAHNQFNLLNCKNVGLTEEMDSNDYNFFKESQIKMCGAYANIDYPAEADALPFEDHSLDYIITSHVIEHLPNPIKVFKEWNRVIKPGGKIFAIIPLRNALESDIGRDITPLETFIRAYKEKWSVDTVPSKYEARVPGGKRGHYFVYTPESFKELLAYCKRYYRLNWNLIDEEAIDTKVGNGFTMVYQV